MRERLRVSVAMATYNGARFLGPQLESILDQHRQPDELVIVDDSSTDETMEVSETFKRRARFSVRVLANERNLGSTATFERAIQECSGDVVALGD
jgi:glycosyltransferase involved in cell wall biosynthesis